MYLPKTSINSPQTHGLPIFFHSSNRYIYGKKLSMGFGRARSIVEKFNIFFFVHVLLSLKAEICTFSYFDDNKRGFRDKYLELIISIDI